MYSNSHHCHNLANFCSMQLMFFDHSYAIYACMPCDIEFLEKWWKTAIEENRLRHLRHISLAGYITACCGYWQIWFSESVISSVTVWAIQGLLIATSTTLSHIMIDYADLAVSLPRRFCRQFELHRATAIGTCLSCVSLVWFVFEAWLPELLFQVRDMLYNL